MREIKFRAWSKRDECMFRVRDISFPSNLLKMRINLSGGDTLDADDVALMQYTGLKDKNGIEVYEGDILRSEKEGVMGAVEYCDRIASFIVFFKMNNENCYSHLNEGKLDRKERLQYTQIIGNIHEHPELLEVERCIQKLVK